MAKLAPRYDAVKNIVFATALTAGVAMTAPANAAACNGTYDVRSGDTLSRISQKCDVSVSSLIYANPSISSPRDIRTGKRIAIPSDADSAPRRGRTKKFIPVAVIDRRSTGELDGPRHMRVPGAEEEVEESIEETSVKVAALDSDAVETMSYLDYAADENQLYDSPIPLPRAKAREELTVSGTIETGERCATVKTEDGKVYGLRGEGLVFASGKDVEISGKLRASRVCEAEFTIAVAEIEDK